MRRVVETGGLTRKFCTVIALAVFLYGNVWADCDADWLTVDASRNGDNGALVLIARNTNDYPLTYSIRVRSSDLPAGRSQKFSGSLDGQQTTALVNLPAEIKRKEDLSIRCAWTVGSKNSSHNDEHLYLLPYADGTSYRVLQGFGSRFSHRGNEQYAVDFNMRVGTPVHAARGGVIARVVEANDKGCWEDGCGKFANFIVVLHDDGTTGEYYHLQKNGALVSVGEQVSAGQKIGLSGNTGHTTMPHLHFAVYRATDRAQSQSIPLRFISGDGVVYKPRRGRHYQAVMHRQGAD